MKEKLVALLQKHQSPQAAGLTPLILMAVAAMSEEDVAEMLRWMKGVVTELLAGDA